MSNADTLYDAIVRFEHAFKQLGINPPHQFIVDLEDYSAIQMAVMGERQAYFGIKHDEKHGSKMFVRGIEIVPKRRELKK